MQFSYMHRICIGCIFGCSSHEYMQIWKWSHTLQVQDTYLARAKLGLHKHRTDAHIAS